MASMLFSPLKIRGVEFKNRIFLSPMCQYSAKEGMPNDWHLVHLGSRAVGGSALIIAEATGVTPEGRISPDDLGIWNDTQAEAFERITDFISKQDSVPAIQLAHAGRKASTFAPWKGSGQVTIEEGGWQTIAPSAVPFSENYPVPLEMTDEDIRNVITAFKDAAVRSVNAGFKVLELHMAHGYLVHQFLSPLSNFRKDEYGGSLNNRCRLAIEIARAVRNAVPDSMPLIARISATDWMEGGWNPESSIVLAKMLKEEGIDMIDCSSGGNVPKASIPVAFGYQTAFAGSIRREAAIMTGAVGLITSPEQAEQILVAGLADAVVIARELLRNPYWPLQAARVLRADVKWPDQYLRAK